MTTRDIVCDADHPYKHHPYEKVRVVHLDAKEVHDSQRDGYPGGDIVIMECPHCGHRWEKELPQ